MRGPGPGVVERLGPFFDASSSTKKETAACGLATASPTHSESPLNGLSSRESMITPFASSHCDSDHNFCDWQITTGTGLPRLSFGTGFTVEVEPGRLWTVSKAH